MLCRGVASILMLSTLMVVVPWFGRVFAGDDDLVDGGLPPFERLLQQIYEGDATNEEILKWIPELTEQASRQDREAAELAVFALARVSKVPASAIDGLCDRLGDSSHQVRSRAVDGLQLVGFAAVEPLRSLLDHCHGRKRAAVVTALARLQAFKLGEIERLAHDTDPRVRAAIATALSLMGKSGVPLLIQLSGDDEASVAQCAIEALATNREDPESAVFELTKRLAEKDRGPQALESLADYGIDAKRSIPAILRAASESHETNTFFNSRANITLSRIGPPDKSDIDVLRGLLTQSCIRVRELAADSLQRLGPEASIALPELEQSFRFVVEELAVHLNDEDVDWHEFRVRHGALRSILRAIWSISRDAKRVATFAQECSAKTDHIINLSGFCHEFADVDVVVLLPLLESENVNVIKSGLWAASAFGPRGIALKPIVISLSRDERNWNHERAFVARDALEALQSMGVEATVDLHELLLERIRAKLMTPLEACYYLDAEVPNSELSQILEQTLPSINSEKRASMVRALLNVSPNQEHVISIILKAVEEENLTEDDAICALTRMKSLHPSGMAFLKLQLNHEDPVARASIIKCLLRQKSSKALTIEFLRSLTEDEDDALRLVASDAIFQWYDDPAPLQPEFSKVLATGSTKAQYACLQRIADLKENGVIFSLDVLKAARSIGRVDFQGTEMAVIKALASIRSEKTMAALQEVSTCKDWRIRSQAKLALEQAINVQATKSD